MVVLPEIQLMNSSCSIQTWILTGIQFQVVLCMDLFTIIFQVCVLMLLPGQCQCFLCPLLRTIGTSTREPKVGSMPSPLDWRRLPGAEQCLSLQLRVTQSMLKATQCKEKKNCVCSMGIEVQPCERLNNLYEMGEPSLGDLNQSHGFNCHLTAKDFQISIFFLRLPPPELQTPISTHLISSQMDY